MDSIPFLVALPEKAGENEEMGMFSNLERDADIGLRQIPVDVLRSNLANISLSVLNVLEDIKQVGRFKLKEVTLEVEVSASGGVSLIGTANLGGKGAISLKFTE
jgi:hypothetical protein